MTCFHSSELNQWHRSTRHWHYVQTKLVDGKRGTKILKWHVHSKRVIWCWKHTAMTSNVLLISETSLGSFPVVAVLTFQWSAHIYFQTALLPCFFSHFTSDVPCRIMQYLSSPSLSLYLSLHAATAGIDQTSLSKMAMIIQTSCHYGATSPLIPASHPFVHPFQHSLLNVTLLPQYSHMGSGFTLFIPNKLRIYNADSMKTCAILWCHPSNSETQWALKHSLIEI